MTELEHFILSHRDCTFEELLRYFVNLPLRTRINITRELNK
jgi:hypothetical protein